MMKTRIAFFVALLALAVTSFPTFASAQDQPETIGAADENGGVVKNRVVVMGMIHRNHRNPGPYDIEHLKVLMQRVQPDYVLTEIPPDRLEAASQQFRETGEITESRVRVFPEYTDALFPLTAEMEFQIIPCAAWTTEMNNSRRATLQELQQSHAEESAEVAAAQDQASRFIAALGDRNDPATIHTDQYDRFVKQGMLPYDRHFNDLIGDGGWTNINNGHYGLIEKALNEHTGEGKTFLITFGSWHKYFIKEQLAKRTDIEVIPMSDYLEPDLAPSDWPAFRLNSSGNNSYGSTEIQNPEVHWKYPTGDVIESSAIVVDGTVFVGGHSSTLHAIDQQTGEAKWKFETGGWVRATPSAQDGIVYFGSDDNKFYALDAKTGEKAWDFPLGEGGEQSSPAIVDGVVYFGAFDHFVYALNAKTGEEIWKFDAGASMLSSPTVADQSLYIGTYEGKVFSLDLKSGEENWMFHENDKPVFSTAVVSRGIVVFTSYDKHVYGVDAGDGSIKWKFETDGEIFSSPTIVGDHVYVGSNDSNLYHLQLETGEQVWKRNLNGAVFSSPAVTDHSIYVGSSDGHVYALQRDSGDVRWKFHVGDNVRVWTSPVALSGKLYFGSHDGELIVLREKE